jgi:hypothetical protein
MSSISGRILLEYDIIGIMASLINVNFLATKSLMDDSLEQELQNITTSMGSTSKRPYLKEIQRVIPTCEGNKRI